MTHRGYIKRVEPPSYRSQRRGGKGMSGVKMRTEDFVTDILVANTRDSLIVFTSEGMSYRLGVHRIPEESRQGRGRALANLLPIESGAVVTAVLAVAEADEQQNDNGSMIFITAKGCVRRNARRDFADIRRSGKRAIRLDEDDRLIGVRIATRESSLFLATRLGKAIRFPVEAVRLFKSRDSGGVRAIRLAGNDSVVSVEMLDSEAMSASSRDAFMRNRHQEDESPDLLDASDVFRQQEELLLTVTANGFGKLSSAYAYPLQGRGGMGNRNIGDLKRNGSVVASLKLTIGDEVMLMTDIGRMIRCPVDRIRISGRGAKGVNLMRMMADEQVVAVTRIAPDESADL